MAGIILIYIVLSNRNLAKNTADKELAMPNQYAVPILNVGESLRTVEENLWVAPATEEIVQVVARERRPILKATCTSEENSCAGNDFQTLSRS